MITARQLEDLMNADLALLCERYPKRVLEIEDQLLKEKGLNRDTGIIIYICGIPWAIPNNLRDSTWGEQYTQRHRS